MLGTAGGLLLAELLKGCQFSFYFRGVPKFAVSLGQKVMARRFIGRKLRNFVEVGDRLLGLSRKYAEFSMSR